jgi:hypothetical protein
MTLMLDSVTPTNIPTSTEVVGGYVNGRYAWKPTDWARFPLSHKVTISTYANGPTPFDTIALVLDVETGDAAPEEAPEWVLKMRFIRVDPVIYCNLATWPTVMSAFHQANVPIPKYWIASWDGVPSVSPAWAYMGCVAKQYQSTSLVDMSVTVGTWPA